MMSCAVPVGRTRERACGSLRCSQNDETKLARGEL
jgi:hypothetical protein